MIENDRFAKIVKKMSMSGRIAIVLRGIEHYLEIYRTQRGFLFEKALNTFWTFTETDDLGQWQEQAFDAWGNLPDDEDEAKKLFEYTLWIGECHLYCAFTKSGEKEVVKILRQSVTALSRLGIDLGDMAKVRAFTPSWSLYNALFRSRYLHWGQPFKREDIIPLIDYQISEIIKL